MPANRTDIEDARNKEWFSDPSRKLTCKNCGESCISEARTFFDIGFSSGARWAIFYSARLSPMFNKFVELITYLWPEDKSS